MRLSIANLFAISPDVRAASCRQALELDGLPADLRARLLAQLFHNLVVANRPDEAEILLAEVTTAVDATDDRTARFTLQLACAGLAYIRGRFDPALAAVDAALRTSVEADDDSRTRLAHHIRCGVLAILDRYDEALIGSGVPGVAGHGAWLLAQQAMTRGDPAAALDHLRALGEKERLSIFPLFPLDPADDPQMVRIALAAGDHELAESTVAAAEARRAANPTAPTLAASAAHARGLLTDDPELLAAAVAGLETGPRRLALASACEDLAVARRGAGSSHDAIAFLDRALAAYAASGATGDAARVRRRLRDLGIRRRQVSGRRPTRGWAALTDSELGVVELVVGGLTNKQVAERLYVSPHTVSAHLRHAFEKLGVNSRVALTRVAAQHTG